MPFVSAVAARRAPALPAQSFGGRFGRGAEPPAEGSYRDVKHYKRRKRWLS